MTLVRESRIPRLPAWALGCAAAWATAVFVAHAASAGLGPEASPCHVRRLTGIPCPTCGGTRSVASLLGGDLGAAWIANPLVLVASFVASTLLALRLVAGLRPSLRIAPAERPVAWVVAGMLLLANWAWLCARGG